MDEIENYKVIKKLMKIFVIVCLLLVLLNFIVKIINGNIILNCIIIFLSYIALLIMIIIIPMILYATSNKIRELIHLKTKIAKNEEYIRDIEIKYSPAIISLILDLQISCFKDYTAMILYLCYRKYIDMYKENDDIKFKIITENVNDLNPHEQYVYRCLNGSSFNEKKFKNLIIEDAKNLGLISFKNGNIKRTSKGKNEAILWKGFKNYIHDYTLISEKEIEHMAILNEYIPYAIALDEAKNIEKFIAEDENYRKLIYKFYDKRI